MPMISILQGGVSLLQEFSPCKSRVIIARRYRVTPFCHGSAIIPLVVPFRNGEVDYEDDARLCESQIENGAD